MPENYLSLAAAMKALTQGEGDAAITLPVAENGWNTRPNADSYGIVQLDFEAEALYGDNSKVAESFEGSFDLYSRSKNGAGWVPIIREALAEHCEGCWRLNHVAYEAESRLFHWEWTFQIEGD